MATIADDILGLYETHLPVAHLERSIAFYQGRLGLELAHVIDERKVAFFWVGERRTGMLGIWETGSSPLHMRLHFAFRAPKQAILESCERLAGVGIQPQGFGGETAFEPVVIGWMPSLQIYFKDPDGHSLEMLHVLDDEPDATFGVQPYSKWLTYQKHRAGSQQVA